MSVCETNDAAATLARHHDPDRFREVASLHQNALAWRPQERIPLGIHVSDPAHVAGLTYDRMLDAKLFFEAQVKMLADELEVGSDLLPLVPLNHLGHAPLTSMFGAHQHMPDQTGGSLQDVGPTPLPVFDDIEQIAQLQAPPVSAGIMPDVDKMLVHYRRNLPEWVGVVGPMPDGPVSAAMELRGSDFLLDMVDQPDLAKRLILTCAETLAASELHYRQILGADPDRHPTNFGVESVGVRLGEDSICNVSAEMIREFCSPAYAMMNRLCGGAGHVHFCSLPHSRLEHIYPALLAMPEVSVVSSQFGFEYYQEHLDELRGRLAVESFYGDALAYVRREHGSFGDWAAEFVPRYKNESGLVLYTQVSSVDEGKKLWEAWRRAHEL